MTRESYDVIIAGLGIMGSACAARLGMAGYKVLALEQFRLGHDRGSSHGESRLIRTACFEDPAYVPLARASLRMWQEMEADQEETILHKTGVVIFGDPQQSGVLAGVTESARRFGLPLESVPAAAAGRWPGLKIPPHWQGLFEEEAGILMVEPALRRFQQEAQESGATLLENCRMTDFRQEDGGILVTTDSGNFHGRHLVITCGAWLGKTLQHRTRSSHRLITGIEKNEMFWFPGGAGRPATTAFALDTPDGFFYGMPPLPGGKGFKLARHGTGIILKDPDRLRDEKRSGEAAVRDFMEHYMPGFNTQPVQRVACMYTMSPDDHFLLDVLPGTDRKVIVAGGFSGHGFKFAPAVGSAVADLIRDRPADPNLILFHL